MLSTELFYLTLIHSFIGYLFEYLTLSPSQVCGVSLKRLEDFKAFWPCYFTTPTVKGMDNFWKVRELIYGFTESCRQIASGMVNAANESMGAIQFCTNPKGNLPHYYYILRYIETLGTDIRNVDCYRLGSMLHLEIQKRKEATKA